jgi:uncharacterized protein YndB with AHSA1/START domain
VAARDSTLAHTTGDLVLSREFQAPRALVWQAWTEPAHLARWWGPHRYMAPRVEIDLRPGGAVRIDMQGPDGQIIPVEGVIEVLRAPEELVFTTSRYCHVDVVDSPMPPGNTISRVPHRVTFEALGARTRVTLRADVVGTTAAAGPLSGMREGWNQSLDRLADLLQVP